MFKSLVTETLGVIINALPVAVRRAAFARAARSGAAYDVFQALGRGHGVGDISVQGDYGPIEGSIEDGSILPRYAREHVWDTAVNRFFVDFFAARQGGTYLDIGANIGLTTIPVACNAAVDCLAFEPDPRNYRYLQANIARNCRQGAVEILNLALFDRHTMIDFALSPANYGDHRILTGHAAAAGRAVIQVAADRLDAVIEPETLRLPLAVKICTQGVECQVLAGGQAVLSAAEALAVKYWPYGIRRAEGDFAFLTGFLAANFSSGAIVAGDCNEALEWRKVKEILETLAAIWRGTPDAWHYYDLFLRK
jgi:FkbM family methyltransferase